MGGAIISVVYYIKVKYRKEHRYMAKNGKIIAFSNQKGGVGKTTSAVNVAAWLGKKGKKVLLCDLDSQGNATSGVGISKKSSEKTVYDVISGTCTAKETVIQTEFKNLWVIPSNMSLAGAEPELVDEEDRVYKLKTAIDPLREEFDYIIIDCPPSLGLLTLNALTAADGVIIPMVCEYYALEGLSQLTVTLRQVKKLYNKDLDITGILVTMYDKRLNLSKSVLEEIKKYYKDQLFKETISRNVRLCEAPSYGMPVVYYDKRSKGAASYEKIASELMKRI